MTKTIITFLLVVLYVALPGSSAGAERKKEFFERLENITNRGTESSIYEQSENCYDSPCGCYRYDSVTRRPTVFVRNTCRRPDDMCVRTGEHADMSAYDMNK